MSPDQKRYIVVRHSAFGYKGDARFEHGLEVRSVHVEAAARFEEKGAKVFPNYKVASDWALKEMYPTPHDKNNLTPAAPGMFMRAQVDGLQVYVPNP